MKTHLVKSFLKLKYLVANRHPFVALRAGSEAIVAEGSQQKQRDSSLTLRMTENQNHIFCSKQTIISLIFLVFSGLVCRSSFGEERTNDEMALLRAGVAFDDGDFAKAASIYENVISKGIKNGHIFYNLGCTYYKLGRPGLAMASFLTARKYLPRDPDVLANLRSVHAKTVDRLDINLPRGAWAVLIGFLVFKTTVKELAFMTVFLCSAFFIFMGVTIIFTKFGRFRFFAWICLGLTCFFIIILGINFAQRENWGAVTSNMSDVYSGPGDKNTVIFKLNEGAPFVWRETEGNWDKIELSDGKKGWIKTSQIKLFL